jgi:hypothetical protein
MRGTVSSRWNWLEDVVIPAISAVMYATWLAPLLRVLMGSLITHPRDLIYPWWAIIAVLLAAAWLSRLLAELPGARWIVAGIGLLVTVVSVPVAYGTLSMGAIWQSLVALIDFSQGLPAGLIVLLTTLGLWVGGARADWTQYRQLMRGFLIGILTLALLSLVSPGAVQGEELVIFLLAGLLALALLTVASHLAYQAERGLPRPALSRYWLMAMGVAMLGILLAGWVLSLFFAPEIMASLLGRLRPLLIFIGDVIAYVGMLILWAFYTIYQWLSALFQTDLPMPPDEPGELPPAFTQQFPDLELTPGTPPSLPEGLGTVLVVGLFIALVVIVLIYAWRKRPRRRYQTVASEEREYIWSKDLILDRWRGLFENLPRRRRRELFAETLDPTDPAHRIREAYRLVLLNARERGLPRRPGQTVSAYRDRVTTAVPATKPPLETLSDAYLQARYADATPPRELADEAQQASQAAVEELVHPRPVRRGR